MDWCISKIIVPVVCFLAVIYSQTGFSCTVCGVGKEEAAGAFILTTGILTFSPLLLAGAAGYYIYKKTRDPEARDGHES